MNTETALMHEIMVAVRDLPYFPDQRRHIPNHGWPIRDDGWGAGWIFSDLFGIRNGDGRAVFIEVKTKKGSAAEFLETMRGRRAGIARSVQDAIEIVEG